MHSKLAALALSTALLAPGCHKPPAKEADKVEVSLRSTEGPSAVEPPSRSTEVTPAPSATIAQSTVSISEGTTVTAMPVALPHEDPRPIDHLARARTLREQGELDGAFTEARRALFDAPDDVEALGAVAKLGTLTRHKDVAVGALAHQAELEKDDPVPLIQQGRLLLSMKDPNGAIEAGEAALARDPDSVAAFQLLGRAHFENADLAGATALFEKVISLSPDQGYALNNLGLCYLRTGKNDEAVKVLGRAAELLPEIAYVQNNLGVALERVGRVEEAKIAYEKAVELSPKYVKGQINAARVAALVMPPSPPAPEQDEDEQVVP